MAPASCLHAYPQKPHSPNTFNACGAGVAVFFGYTGAHGFYSWLTNSALATLLLCILGWLLIIDFIGLLFPALLAVRGVVDFSASCGNSSQAENL